MNREEAEKEAKALNRMLNTHRKVERTRCRGCNGEGKTYTPLFGDPNLGHSASSCLECGGEGFHKIRDARTGELK